MKKVFKRFMVGALTASMVFGMMSGMGMNAWASGDGSDTAQSDQNSKLGYNVHTNDDNRKQGFDVWGIDSEGKTIMTTCKYRGYKTMMKVDDNSVYSLLNTGAGEPVFTLGKDYENNGVKVSIDATLLNDSVRITYNIENTNDKAVTLQLGTWGDTMIGNQDYAPVYIIDDMIIMKDSTNEEDVKNTFVMQSNGDLTTRWIGLWSSANGNVFNNSTIQSLLNTDSGIAWSWTIELAKNEKTTRSVSLAAGDIKLANIIYDKNGGSGSMAETVGVQGEDKTVTLRECTFTKKNSAFMGWASDKDKADNGEVEYDDAQEIAVPDKNITLYAVWGDYVDQVITAEDVELKYGETKSINAETDGKGVISYKIKEGEDFIELDEETGEVKAKKVGEATVTVTASARMNYNEATKDIKITVSPVEKKDLEAAIKDAQDYYDSIKDKYKDIADELYGAIDEAEETVAENNVDDKEVADAFQLLQDAVAKAEGEIKDIEDTEEAKKVEEVLNKLPAADKVAESDKEAVEAARKAYDELTEDQKKKVNAETLKKLTDAEDKIKAIEEAAKKAEEDAKKAEEEAKKEAEKNKPSNEWIDGQWYDSEGNASYEPKGEWKCNSSGWWFEDTSGWYANSQWVKIDGNWYYFLDSGYLDYSEYRDGYWLGSDGALVDGYHGEWKSDATGWWFEDESGWYPVSQWVWINGSCYYFEASGYLAVSKYVDGYWVGADGACQ